MARKKRNRRRRGKRVFRTAAVLLAAALLLLVLRVGGSYALVSLGITTDHGWSLLRWGHRERHDTIDLLGDWAEDASHHLRRTSGPLFARAGERLKLSYAAAPRRGKVTFVVDHALGGPGFIWRETFEIEGRGEASVALPTTGLYQVRLLFGNFKGSAEIDWRIE